MTTMWFGPPSPSLSGGEQPHRVLNASKLASGLGISPVPSFDWQTWSTSRGPKGFSVPHISSSSRSPSGAVGRSTGFIERSGGEMSNFTALVAPRKVAFGNAAADWSGGSAAPAVPRLARPANDNANATRLISIRSPPTGGSRGTLPRPGAGFHAKVASPPKRPTGALRAARRRQARRG